MLEVGRGADLRDLPATELSRQDAPEALPKTQPSSLPFEVRAGARQVEDAESAFAVRQAARGQLEPAALALADAQNTAHHAGLLVPGVQHQRAALDLQVEAAGFQWYGLFS